MKRPSAALLGKLALTAVAIFLGYETFAVVTARGDTPRLFAKYERPASDETTPLDHFTPQRIDALIKVQDPDFWSHRGVDAFLPLTTTTVTQSIVKQLYFAKFQQGFPKIKQTLIARFAVDPLTSKNAQLTAFVNLVGFGEVDGRAVHGFENGAKAWFGKPLAEISEEQFLSLLAMMIRPRDLSPGSPANNERVARIEKYLASSCERRGLSDVWLDACAARAP
jgi:monofunctional biosynthetic peptidoglycan transglycosylase